MNGLPINDGVTQGSPPVDRCPFGAGGMESVNRHRLNDLTIYAVDYGIGCLHSCQRAFSATTSSTG